MVKIQISETVIVLTRQHIMFTMKSSKNVLIGFATSVYMLEFKKYSTYIHEI